MIQLTKTGIDGLDEILNGGIVKNSTTLISGNPGAGKSILCLQYIYNGVEQFDEKGIYLSFEENESDLREAAESIGFDKWPEYVESGDIKVYDKQVLLRENGLTTLMTNEQGAVFPETEIGLENYLTDGNIYLIQTPTDSGVSRYVWVAKMRKQNIETDIYPMEIDWGGIKVHENASAFSMMSEEESPI